MAKGASRSSGKNQKPLPWKGAGMFCPELGSIFNLLCGLGKSLNLSEISVLQAENSLKRVSSPRLLVGSGRLAMETLDTLCGPALQAI